MIIKEETVCVPTEDRASIDIQVSTAHRYPRNIARARQEALEMATSDVETAASCFYKLSRGGKEIEGPGVRLAEILGSAWGNMRYSYEIVGETDKFITARGMAFDLEKNVAASISVQRRITDKYGKKYSDDMIAITANAAGSIALRNAIFKVIPKTFIESIYEAAKQVAIGDATTLTLRRQKALEFFQKTGIKTERVLIALGKTSVEEIGLSELETLTGLRTAIKDGDVTLDAAFPADNTSKTESLAEKLKKKESEPESSVDNLERKNN